MARLRAVALALILSPATLVAQEAQVATSDATEAPAEQGSHTVSSGETLWELAFRYYNDPFHWPTLFEANRDHIDNAHWIYPGQVFVVPGSPNQPPQPFPPAPADERAVVGTVAVNGPAGAVAPPATGGGGSPAMRPRRERSNLEPEYRTVFYGDDLTRRGGFISAGQRDWLVVPRDVFYGAEWLSSTVSAPHVAEVAGFHRNPGTRGDLRTARAFQRIRLTLKDGHGLEVGDHLLAFRMEWEALGLGFVMQPTGRLVVSRMEEGGAVAVVTTEYDQVKVGDLTKPLPSFPLQKGIYPGEVHAGAEGTILGFAERKELHGHGDIVFISLGEDDGVAVGDELDVRAPNGAGGWSSDAEGRLQVVHIGDRTSSARVIGLDNPVFVEGARVRVIRAIANARR